MSRADFDGITCNSQQHPQTADCRRQPTNIRQPATTAVAAQVEEGLLGTAGDVARTRDAVGDGVHIREADVVAVEAIRLVDLCEARVVGLDECDVDALRTMLANAWKTARYRQASGTHRVQRSTVHRQLNHLDRGVIASLDVRTRRKGYLRQADSAGIRVFAGSEDLEGGHHRVRHVGRATVGAVCAEAEVHVDEGCCMALEPARLE
jgi:hypothetical protein